MISTLLKHSQRYLQAIIMSDSGSCDVAAQQVSPQDAEHSSSANEGKAAPAPTSRSLVKKAVEVI